MRVTVLASFFVFVSTAITSSADPEPKKFENLPTDAEIHLVAVSEPLFPGLSEEEVTNGLGLVKQLREKEGEATHIRKLLWKVADEVLTDEVAAGRIEDWPVARVNRFVKHRLSVAFSQTLRTKSLFDKDAFAKAELPPAVAELVKLGDKRTTFQTQRLNRELLTLVFPNCIAQVPDDFQTVYVTVKPGKPVVLVTSSSYQARWKVTVEKGATVAGVIQFGNTAQEVVGVDAPIIYRAAVRPDGTKGPTNGFNAFKQDDNEPSYKRIKAEVKEYTGQDFTSFQGKYQATKEPFVVKPGAK